MSKIRLPGYDPIIAIVKACSLHANVSFHAVNSQHIEEDIVETLYFTSVFLLHAYAMLIPHEVHLSHLQRLLLSTSLHHIDAVMGAVIQVFSGIITPELAFVQCTSMLRSLVSVSIVTFLSRRTLYRLTM